MNIFYVYVILDPRNIYNRSHCGINFEYTPIYIGKGKEDRKDFHLFDSRLNTNTGNKLKNNTLKKIIKMNLNPIITIVKKNLSEEKSFILEKELIKDIGRRIVNSGPLTNITDGGEGQSGNFLSFMGENNPFYGKKHNINSHTHLCKSVNQLSLQGEILETYHSLEEAARKTNSISTKISLCAKGKRKTHNGYKWEFVNSVDIFSTKQVGKKQKFRKIVQKHNGKTIKKWDKIIEICNTLGYSKIKIIDCLKGRRNFYNGFSWKYEL